MINGGAGWRKVRDREISAPHKYFSFRRSKTFVRRTSNMALVIFSLFSSVFARGIFLFLTDYDVTIDALEISSIEFNASSTVLIC